MVAMADEQAPASFGPNAWLVDEMYEQYRQDPSAVSESWQEFFADYRPGPERPRRAGKDGTSSNGGGAATAVAPAPQPVAAAPVPPKAEAPVPQVAGTPIRGAGARIVENMEKSLAVPTATSFRQVPARLLEVN